MSDSAMVEGELKVIDKTSHGRVRTRPIAESDIDPVAQLLVQGFRRSTRRDWLHIFNRLACHPTPEGFPMYGYMLESEGMPVGVILLVSSSMPPSGAAAPTRCSLSSWYVSPAYRSYAHLLMARILKNDDVTYMNVSPDPHTFPLLRVQGFSRYSDGQFFAVAAPSLPFPKRQARVVSIRDSGYGYGGNDEYELLLAHARYGCMSFWCMNDGHACPFVLRRRMIKGFVPCAQLIYSRTIEEFVHFSGAIGRYLARRGMPLVMIDSCGRIPGLTGMYVNGMLPKYYKGPIQPRLGDLAYTETALFGI